MPLPSRHPLPIPPAIPRETPSGGPASTTPTYPWPALFRIPRLREGSLLTVRADAFNILNHANLGNPDNLLGSLTFGLASYGRQGAPSGFPAVAPLNETARQIQILLRVEF